MKSLQQALNATKQPKELKELSMVQPYLSHQKLVVYHTDSQVSVLVVEQQLKCYGEDLNLDQLDLSSFQTGQVAMGAGQEVGLSIRHFATFSLN
jgi:hypothetical protein